MPKVISIGNQGFEDIRKENRFYVDKTEFIREWWESGDSITLIILRSVTSTWATSAPRMSTMRSWTSSASARRAWRSFPARARACLSTTRCSTGYRSSSSRRSESFASGCPETGQPLFYARSVSRVFSAARGVSLYGFCGRFFLLTVTKLADMTMNISSKANSLT